jgi:hypothetical protein
MDFGRRQGASRSHREALRMPSLAYAEHGKKKAWFFLSYNFNDLRHLIDGTSMCRRTSAHFRRGSMQRYGDAEQRSIRAKDAKIIQGICETPH